jgi:hypothetical protein
MENHSEDLTSMDIENTHKEEQENDSKELHEYVDKQLEKVTSDMDDKRASVMRAIGKLLHVALDRGDKLKEEQAKFEQLPPEEKAGKASPVVLMETNLALIQCSLHLKLLGSMLGVARDEKTEDS